MYFRAPPNLCLGDENTRLPEDFCSYILRAKFLIAVISAKYGSMPAGAGRGGPGRGGLAAAGAGSGTRSVRMYRTGSRIVRSYVLIDDMFESLAQGASHPAVAAWLGLGTAAVAAVVVAMAWSVNARQIRLAELLARRQFPVSSGKVTAKESAPEVEGGAAAAKEGAARAKPAAKVPPEVIDGPDEVVAGEQARYRVQTGGPHQVVSWAVGGGGAVSHGPDPGHPGDLLLIAEQPGDLTLIARVREGLTERRATKTITAVPEVAEPTPPFSLRLFLHGWGLIVVAVLIVGFAGALNALGNFTSSDFIAVAVPLAALLGVLAVARGPGAGEPGGRSGNSHGLGNHGHGLGNHGHGAGKRHGQA